METEAAGQSPVQRMVGRPAPERASACGLTECAGKQMCVRCASVAEMEAMCSLLPEGVYWGDPLTPELLRELLSTGWSNFPPQIPNEFGHLLTPDALWRRYAE